VGTGGVVSARTFSSRWRSDFAGPREGNGRRDAASVPQSAFRGRGRRAGHGANSIVTWLVTTAFLAGMLSLSMIAATPAAAGVIRGSAPAVGQLISVSDRGGAFGSTCSATALASTNGTVGTVVVAAGHCVIDQTKGPHQGQHYNEFFFRPGWDQGVPGRKSQLSEFHASWNAVHLDSRWLQGDGAYDFAFIRMEPDARGVLVGAEVGGGIHLAQSNPAYGQAATVSGYPGGVYKICGPGTTGNFTDGTWRPGDPAAMLSRCGLSEGSSGGPWLDSRGYLVAVTGKGSPTDNTGTYMGEAARTQFNLAQGYSSPTSFMPPAGYSSATNNNTARNESAVALPDGQHFEGFQSSSQAFLIGQNGTAYTGWERDSSSLVPESLATQPKIPEGTWVGWSALPGVSFVQGQAVVATNADGRMEIFAVGSNRQLYHTAQSCANCGFGPWGSLAGGVSGKPAVARNTDGRLEVFVRGTDGELYGIYQVCAGCGWGSWYAMRAGPAGKWSRDPVVNMDASGDLVIFIVGPDLKLYQSRQSYPSGGWTTWQSLGGSWPGNPSVIRNDATQRLEVFMRGGDNFLWRAVQVASNTYAWENLCAGASNWCSITYDPAVGANRDGRLEVFAVSPNKALYHIVQKSPGGSWGAWSSLSGSLTTNPTVMTNADGRLEVFDIGIDSGYWHIWQTCAGCGWTSWSGLGGSWQVPSYGMPPASFKLLGEAGYAPDGRTPVDLGHAWMGETGYIDVAVQNTGTADWGPGAPISLATYQMSDPLYNPGWVNPQRPAVLPAGRVVAPGQSYTFRFPFTVGITGALSFVSRFDVVTEGVGYMPDGGINVKVTFVKTVDRAVVLRHLGPGGYAMAPDGTITAFGGAPFLASNSIWTGWDIARGIVLRSDDFGGYILDGWGGIHPFGNAPSIGDQSSHYWTGWDIARSIVLRTDNLGGYVLDGWGGIHPFGNAPYIAPTGYWTGWDIARSMVLRTDNLGGYVLDGWGGVHTFGNAPSIGDQSSHYWTGWDIARTQALSPSGNTGVVLDANGGIHPWTLTPGCVTCR
jgi:hypothetical protein